MCGPGRDLVVLCENSDFPNGARGRHHRALAWKHTDENSPSWATDYGRRESSLSWCHRRWSGCPTSRSQREVKARSGNNGEES